MKKLILMVIGFVGMFSSSAFAAIAVDKDTGIVSGTLDVAPYLSAAGVILVALGAMWALKKVMSLLRV